MRSEHQPELRVALLTAGRDKPYAFGMATALRASGVQIDLIAGQELDLEEFRNDSGVNLMLLRREPETNASFLSKAAGLLQYYIRLVCYAWSARPTVFHILWNNKFETFDRVILMLYYRMLGKRVVLTAHNVNTADRDATDSALNRLTLKCQYRLCHHIFVHTGQMKADLLAGFGVSPSAVSVIPFGINNSVPHTGLTPEEARRRLGLSTEKVILFFGNIAPYKGLEYLIDAFRHLRAEGRQYRLIVAGRPKGGVESYWDAIKASIGDEPERDGILLKIEFIPDEETEVYFKAADVLALPYTSIFQSGVLFLGYSFGLPVLAADVGSLREEIIEGQTGFVFAAQDSAALVGALETYFESELFLDLSNRRREIQEHANARYSWAPVANTTRDIYAGLQGLIADPHALSQRQSIDGES
jgi:glycosyltransferase involved in cell wall biosynthesis